MAETISTRLRSSNPPIHFVWFSFDGRINRSTYWLKYVLPAAGVYPLAFSLDLIGGTFPIITLAATLFMIWPTLAAGAKRCHDRSHSGWFQLITLIPFIGGVWLFIELGLLPGAYGANQYGPDTVLR